MRLPTLFRRTPFRVTLLFLALFAATASAVLAYVYVASASEAQARARSQVRAEADSLMAVYRARGFEGLNVALIERISRGGPSLYVLTDANGGFVSRNLDQSPISPSPGATEGQWDTFRLTETDDQGRVERPQGIGVDYELAGGERLFVGQSMGDTERYLDRLTQALWGAMAMVLLLGLSGGLIISRNVERSMGRLNKVVLAVQEGDLRARADVRSTGDELDELGQGLNTMLDRLETSMASIRHAGDAIAHDLRSPLTRMRAKLEVALIDAEAGKVSGVDALGVALDEADALLKTFNTVLAIARLQAAAGRTPDPALFDAADLAEDMAELYEPAAEDKGLEFSAEIERGLMVEANQPFLAQALANVIDNAIKYTPPSGAVKLRARRRSSGEIEFSVTDTGPGVPEADRERVIQRFVRLDNSRTEAGSGLGLSLVAAVIEAHGGRITLDEGPGVYDGSGPGLRVALILPPASA
ncbi:HAMP domain-containing histidine kinase [Brevundimonas vitis]|uniref:histidine kinase n=1 Tax=Brevundimonas vitisensis TaxID=2800818 RepID=A0ABX7BKS7_9CAUL|nr:HAMP domain-containing sensor histidine kinase [Brevundimonas vitisensis]QQQ18161.1 HAMP domain-containing histidine kinase [Brevundimonas vitisensis]